MKLQNEKILEQGVIETIAEVFNVNIDNITPAATLADLVSDDYKRHGEFIRMALGVDADAVSNILPEDIVFCDDFQDQCADLLTKLEDNVLKVKNNRVVFSDQDADTIVSIGTTVQDCIDMVTQYTPDCS